MRFVNEGGEGSEEKQEAPLYFSLRRHYPESGSEGFSQSRIADTPKVY